MGSGGDHSGFQLHLKQTEPLTKWLLAQVVHQFVQLPFATSLYLQYRYLYGQVVSFYAVFN